MYINRPAVDKAQFVQQVLHDFVVPVGVYAKMMALIKGPIQAEFAYALPCTVTGNAMNHSIGTVIQPLSQANRSRAPPPEN